MTKTLLAVMLLWSPPPDSVISLPAVEITTQTRRDVQSTQRTVHVDAEELTEQFSGSLSQSLERVNGVKASAIGSGLSRPSIRGMGFNRMVVSENGIKHESQQWGDDHGLEMDQFAVDGVEVVKGPATLRYGSDAIGGVVSLKSNQMPAKPFAASASLFGRANNDQLGFSARAAGRNGGFFYKMVVTGSDYGDYRVPTDEIAYYSYIIHLKEHRLRNTAGKERDAHLTVGYTDNERFRTALSFSDVYARSGFFADAHGMEVRLSKIDYDGSTRDVDLPSQWVNHMKVQNHSTLQLGSVSLEGGLAWQHNRRKELTEPLSHGYMPTPPDSLERAFNKRTWSGFLNARVPVGHHELHAGIDAEGQRNRRSGWGFILPDFESRSVGAFATDRYSPNAQLTLNGGVRYDLAHIDIHGYHDWYATPTANGDSLCKERSAAVGRDFRNFSWSVGGTWHDERWIVRLNAGEAFRVPVAKELGADGVNYHIFRYEQGNSGLDAERSYQVDAGVEWSNAHVRLKADPYVNYFPNYIYLNPTPRYEEGLQLYRYTQAEAWRVGGEAEAAWEVDRHWEVELRGQYCRARQLSGDKKGYSLPFAVPPSADAELGYRYRCWGEGEVVCDVHMVAAQNEIVPPEKKTPGYATLNLSLAHRLPLHKGLLSLSVQLNNLLDKRYFDHTSYYRLMDIPEPGRNLSVKVKWEW